MKPYIFPLLAALLLVSVPAVAAQTPSLPDPGIKPDHPLYWLDRAFESLQMAFTFNDTNRAQLQIEFANERVAEAKAMIEKGKIEYVPTLMTDYQEHIDYARQVSSLAQDTELSELVAVATGIHQVILSEILEKVPPQAKSSIEASIQTSERGQQEALNAIKATQGEAAFQDAQKKVEDEKNKAERVLTEQRR